MMHDPKLIEAMARALCCPEACFRPSNCAALRWYHDAATDALTAICAARPDVAAVLAGEAVAVPRGGTVDMIGEFWRYKNGHHWPDEPAPTDVSDMGALRAMLAASPYAREPGA